MFVVWIQCYERVRTNRFLEFNTRKEALNYLKHNNYQEDGWHILNVCEKYWNNKLKCSAVILHKK